MTGPIQIAALRPNTAAPRLCRVAMFLAPSRMNRWCDEGAGTTDRRGLHADERRSRLAISNVAGNALGINRYDEYIIPQANNVGRFGYTGQAWLPEIGMKY